MMQERIFDSREVNEDEKIHQIRNSRVRDAGFDYWLRIIQKHYQK